MPHARSVAVTFVVSHRPSLFGQTMRLNHTGRFAVALVLGVSACQSAGPPASVESPTPMGACTARVLNVDLSGWREVRATGFTFCVPADWTQRDRQWQLRSSSVEWNTGDPPPRSGRFKVVVAPAGSPVPATSGGIPRPEDRFNATETIGGRRAELNRAKMGDRYQTSARWQAPNVYLDGEAGNLAAAELHLTIYRTVRFIPTS